MKKLIFITLIVLLLQITSYAQNTSYRIRGQGVAAGLPCYSSTSSVDVYVNSTTGLIYSCIGGVWTVSGNSGSGAANRVTYWTGTNVLGSTNGFSFSSNNLSIPAGGQFQINGSQIAFSNLAGNIAVSQMNSGTSASSSTFWRGDGTWASASGGITNSAGNNIITKSNGTNVVASSLTDDGALISSTLNLAIGGASPAATGALRIPNNTYLYSRNQVNSGDQQIIGQNSSGSVVLAGLWFINPSSGAFGTTSTYPITWSGDSGIARNAAGVLEINNSSSGTYRDLKLRHIIGGGTSPSCAVGGATIAGTGATCSVSGNDSFGELTLNTGTGVSATGTFVTLTFNTSYAAAPSCVYAYSNSTAVGISSYINTSTSTFTLLDTANLTSSSTYKFMYHCGGQ